MFLSIFYPLLQHLSKLAIPPLLVSVVPPNVLSWLCFVLAHPIIIFFDVPAQILLIRCVSSPHISYTSLICSYRNSAIEIPHRLPWLSPRENFAHLLTPYERHHPFFIYTSHLPLVYTRSLLLLIYTTFMPLSTLLIPNAQRDIGDFILLAIEIIALYAFIWWIFLTPLLALTPRLAIQQVQVLEGEEQWGQEAQPENADARERVIRVRGRGDDAGLEPYRGLWNAITTIGVEEGYWKVLYRLFYFVCFDVVWLGFGPR